MVLQQNLNLPTRGRDTTNITSPVTTLIQDSGFRRSICQLFIQHNSASLILCENADPNVRSDLERFMARLVKDDDSIFEHTMEGLDDMSAYIRSILTKMDLSIPIIDGHPGLGIWQGIYLYGHRTPAHHRWVTVTLYGE